MTQKFEDVLDAALEAIKTEPVTAVLNRYPNQADALAPLLAAAEQVKDWQTAVPPLPAASWQAVDRAAFLAQLEQLPVTAVSPNPLLRLKEWLTQKRTALRNRQVQKEQKSMNALLARAVATVAVIFGLGGGTVVLANDSLPDTPLYPVKLMLEETRMALADNPVEQANLQMTLAQVRLQEMTQLMQAGDPVDEPLVARLETHLQTAVQLAAQAGEPEMVALLTQMQTMLQNEQQTMALNGDPTQAMFGEINQIMNQYQEKVQAGLDDPPMFRWRHSQDADWEPAGNGQQNGQEQDEDDNGQNGPGDGTCIGDCEPVQNQNQANQEQELEQEQEQEQNGPGNTNSPGQNNNNAGNPGNNGPNDPGDGSCVNDDCEPVGDQNQYGQDDDNTGQNGPGDGDGVCENDCEPVGDGPQQEQQGDDNGGQNNQKGNGG